MFHLLNHFLYFFHLNYSKLHEIYELMNLYKNLSIKFLLIKSDLVKKPSYSSSNLLNKLNILESLLEQGSFMQLDKNIAQS